MRTWNQEEENTLIEMIKNGITYDEISFNLNRSYRSIREKAKNIGITYKSEKDIKKICLECGKEFEISRHNNSEMNKKFCSQSCSAIYTNIERGKKNKNIKVKKYCCNCGEELHKKQVKFCNSKCQQELQKKEMYKEIEEGYISFHETSYRKYLIDNYGAICMECGWSEINTYSGKIPIQLEHIDGNYKNNNLSNLKLLCPNCHSLTPTFGALNKGNGRDFRKNSRNKDKMNLEDYIQQLKKGTNL